MICCRLVFTGVLLGLLLPIGVSKAASTRHPNVLLIAIDDLNDWVGCLGGHPQAKTPNIDRLAKRGTLFTNAHCQGPICGPSRACLFSGRYPHTTGIYQQPGKKGMLADKEFFNGHMMPEYLAQHGYETMAVGKLMHGYPDEEAFQTYGGKFENFGPKPGNDFRFNYHLPEVPWSGTQTDWGVFPESDGMMPDHKSATWVEERLAEKRGEPFFLAVGFIRPHVPFYVPQKWFDLFPIEGILLPPVRGDDLNDVPEIGVKIHELPKYPDLEFLQADDNKQFKLCVQAYLACIAFVDHQVGRVLDALDASPHKDHTVIVLFSDHGYHLGEKDRVSKHSLWEEATRVPLIVAGPDLPAGNRSDLPVGLIDIYPTLLEMTGVPKKAENEGRSLVPLLKNEETAWRHSILTTYARANDSLRSVDHRYIRYEDGSEELYDLKADPNGWVNMADQKGSKEIIQEFEKDLPKTNAPYHKANSKSPINAWFKKHFAENGVSED